MGRPRTPVGELGSVRAREVTVTNRAGESRTVWRVRGRVRAQDGRLVQVEASGRTKGAAERVFRDRVKQVGGADDGPITGRTRVPDLAEYYLADLVGRKRPQTIDTYTGIVRLHVNPHLGGLTLREVTTTRLSSVVRELEAVYPVQAARVLSVLTAMFDLAVEHGALVVSPAAGVRRVPKPSREVVVLGPDEVLALRAAMLASAVPSGRPGPRPNGNLAALFDVLLGSGVRIGEALALRRCDVDLAAGTIHVRGTMVEVRGEGVFRQDFPKTDESNRVLRLPRFAVDALVSRIRDDGRPGVFPVFATRTGRHVTPSQARKEWRNVLGDMEGDLEATPHTLRRTVATLIEEGASVEAASAVLGHSGTAVTLAHYIARRHRVVDVGDAMQVLVESAGV